MIPNLYKLFQEDRMEVAYYENETETGKSMNTWKYCTQIL